MRRAAGAAGALAASAYGRVHGASERIGLGLVGAGPRGRELLAELKRLSGEHPLRLAAVCDIWKLARERGMEEVKEAFGEAPQPCRNTEELYKQKGLDAVLIATPDHQHARLCLEAVREKKDVYVERPLAHFLDDAREVQRAVRDSGRLVQVGTTRRSSPREEAAARFVRGGTLGEVTAVELGWNTNQPELWRRREDVARLKEADTDWRRFLLHLPAERFDPRKYLESPLFWPYSAGIAGQWLSELIDLVPWFTGDPIPRSCVASGGLYSLKDGRTNPDTFSALFEYHQGFQVHFQGRLHNSQGGVRALFCSRRGTVDLEGGVASGEGGDAAGRLGETARFPAAGGLAHHLRDFLECLRTRRSPRADIDAGYLHSVALCMAVEAFHSGKRIRYDPRRERLEAF